MPTGVITIMGGYGSGSINLSLTVTGTNTLAYAQQFAQDVNMALASGDTVTPLTPGHDARAGMRAATGADTTPIYLTAADSAGGDVFTVPGAGYVIDTVTGAHTINGASNGGDTLLGAGLAGGLNFVANAGGNRVIFVDGNNLYTAGTGDTGGDSIIAGSGFDTIITGVGPTTINSGTGTANITLNDTLTTNSFNDIVWIDDGHANVTANGAGDAVIATTSGQTITGGANALLLGVVLAPNSNQTPNGYDIVNAGAASVTAVYDNSDGNTINAGSGILYVVSGPSISADVNVGASQAYVFGAVGADITLTAPGVQGYGYFIAGSGNETLNGAGSSSTLFLYGGHDSVAGGDVLIGGSGNDLLAAGLGSETLTGGAGSNTFLFDSFNSRSGNVTITDFGAGGGNKIVLNNFGGSDPQMLISGGTEVDGNYVVTLSNTLTITFDGLSSGASLNGHIFTF